MIFRLSVLARLWFLAVLTMSTAGWIGSNAGVPRAWSGAHAWHLDSTVGGADEWVANDLGPVRLTPTFGRISVAEASVLARQVNETHVVKLEPYSTTDNSDQSDASARVESRAGPVVSQQSRPILQVSPLGLRSRTRSSSAPRAPPVALRLA